MDEEVGNSSNLLIQKGEVRSREWGRGWRCFSGGGTNYTGCEPGNVGWVMGTRGDFTCGNRLCGRRV